MNFLNCSLYYNFDPSSNSVYILDLYILIGHCFIENICFRYKAGSLEFYDKQYDRVSVKVPKKLNRINRISHKVPTTDDPIIRKVCFLVLQDFLNPEHLFIISILKLLLDFLISQVRSYFPCFCHDQT